MSTTPVTTPAIDQQVVYHSTSQAAGLNARIVNIWADGPVDVVVTDATLRSGSMLVKRLPYVPFGSTPPAANPYDSRYVIQISTGSGLPAGTPNTAPTEGVANTGRGTEPLES